MADFEAVAQKLRDQKPYLSNEQKSEVYSLYKQGSEGDQLRVKP